MMTLREILLMDNPAGYIRELDRSGNLTQRTAPMVPLLRLRSRPGYQHKDVLDHSLKVLDNAITREQNGPDPILRAGALLHDIGKGPTRRKVDGQVVFDGHEVVGADMVRRNCFRSGFTYEDNQKIAQLVREHMRSHAFREGGDWTDSAVRRLMKDVPDTEQLDRLIIIFYSDVTTRHAHKREKIHRQIDNLLKVMDEVRAADVRSAMRPALNGHDVMDYFGLQPGPELGRIMKFLNSDDGIHLTKGQALVAIAQKFINK